MAHRNKEIPQTDFGIKFPHWHGWHVDAYFRLLHAGTDEGFRAILRQVSCYGCAGNRNAGSRGGCHPCISWTYLWRRWSADTNDLWRFWQPVVCRQWVYIHILKGRVRWNCWDISMQIHSFGRRRSRQSCIEMLVKLRKVSKTSIPDIGQRGRFCHSVRRDAELALAEIPVWRDDRLPAQQA